ncbi:MAG: toll/interleukin-1 receptor domain-containing protein [Lachnospiraceae bacterium]|nr:toll/interleukin-1 receptor domain-containing protein [Lachnospiraceae bacterium]
MEHFNAFISYKHAPEDNVVAEAVHKGLERFHIPGKIQKKTGIKKISRIFRDKDELPITSDLSDTIATALTDSDYLIVICSTNTKKSAWVPREIEYFLKNHTRRQIFTVLVNGEPYDVIPEILLYEEKTVKDENGNEQSVKIPMEPLSCDYRMPMSKAKKTELPRLAAGIIGCSYDELMNRHRQYRMKQLTAVFSVVLAVALGFAGYMFYSRNQIHKTYLESLKNQSRYLANESGNLLEKEQRIAALQLALEALPKNENDDRPVTAEAVKALTDAVLAYEGNDGNNIHAVWNYQMPGCITDFQVSPEGMYVAAYDNGNVVALWNTKTHERCLYLDNLQKTVQGIRFLSDDRLAVWTSESMMCFDANGDQVWENEPEHELLQDDDKFMTDGNSLWILTTENRYLKLDCANGKMIDSYPIPEKEGYEGLGIVESRLSPDGSKIAVRGIAGWNSYAYGIFDMEKKNLQLSPIAEETIKDIGWAGDDYLMVAGSVVDMTGSMSFGNRDLISTDHSTIRCVAVSDLSEKWNADFTCNGVMLSSDFIDLGDGSIGYYSGNVITVYDLSSGKEQYSNNANDSLVDVSDGDGDGTPTYITENGGLAFPALSVDTDAVYYTKYFTDELRQAKIKNGVFVRSNLSSEVIHYASHVYDENWTALPGDTLVPDVAGEYLMTEEALAVLYLDEDKTLLAFFDPSGERDPVRTCLEDENIFDYQLLGISDGVFYLGYEKDLSYYLKGFDLAGNTTGSEEHFDLSAGFDHSAVLKDGKLVYISKDDSYDEFLSCLELKTKQKTEIKTPDDLGYIKHAPVYYEKDNLVILTGDTEYLFDLTNSGSAKLETPEGWAGTSCYSDNCPDGSFAISDGKSILLIDKNGKVKNEIACPGIAPIGMTFIKDELLVIYQDGGMYRYATDDGRMTKKSEVTTYYGFRDEVIFDQDEQNGLFYIQMNDLTDVVDLESGIEITHIMDCLGHHSGKDIFITGSSEENHQKRIGYYKRYTVSELTDMAHDILQNAEISEDMKSRYGIE